MDYILDKNPVIAASLIRAKDVSHAEIADTLFMLKRCGYKPGQLQTLTGYKDYQVRHYFRIAQKLIPPVKQLLHQDIIKLSLARAIASIEPGQQEEVARKAIMYKTSVHQLRAELKEGESYSNKAEKEYFEKIAIKMSEQTGLMISVEPDPLQKNAGMVMLQYTRLDDFDTICERLGVDLEQF